jgi:thiol-disulfide isomerase/thioredoxin
MSGVDVRNAVKICVGVALVQLGFVAVWMLGSRAEDRAPARHGIVQVRHQTELDVDAPLLRYTVGDETEGALSDALGKRVLVHFWGTWCPPCVEELPRLLQWASSDDVVVIAVAIGDDRDSLRTFFEGEVPEAVVLPVQEPRGVFDVERLPVTFLVDVDGRVVRRWSGARKWTATERDAFLAERTGE